MKQSSAFKVVAGVIILLGLVTCSPGQVPDGFEVVRVTNENLFFDVPDINDDSTVVWSAGFPPNIVGNVHRFGDGIIQTITTDDRYDLRPAMNNLGQIAWMQCLKIEQLFDVVVDYGQGPIDIDQGFQTVGSVDINDGGDVVWWYDFGDGVKEIFLYKRAEGTVEQISNNGVFSQTPRINNNRQIVWSAKDSSQSPWTSKIMLYSDGVITELSEGEGQRSFPDISDLGLVVWREGGVGIVLWDAGKRTTILPGDDAAPRINNRGDIHFSRWNELEDQWDACLLSKAIVYVLPDFGLSSARGDMNDRGEISWRGLNIFNGFSDILLLRRIAPKGDFDHDCHIDMHDSRMMLICFTGADQKPPTGLSADCLRGDFDEDGDIDIDDFVAFLAEYTGPAVDVPGCDP